MALLRRIAIAVGALLALALAGGAHMRFLNSGRRAPLVPTATEGAS